ncbi:hypothetical protein TNCV_3992101 [Trichonephila clavipes]|uniref:Uncharacterized protein n=1 Tax=Trichonephila clavipes TaxID=2585209 RepID=A0A8X6SZS5_TRICX|nr:hypothetical protein TNCV_3992101 [Trichonephila clavipes]
MTRRVLWNTRYSVLPDASHSDSCNQEKNKKTKTLNVSSATDPKINKGKFGLNNSVVFCEISLNGLAFVNKFETEITYPYS